MTIHLLLRFTTRSGFKKQFSRRCGAIQLSNCAIPPVLLFSKYSFKVHMTLLPFLHQKSAKMRQLASFPDRINIPGDILD